MGHRGRALTYLRGLSSPSPSVPLLYPRDPPPSSGGTEGKAGERLSKLITKKGPPVMPYSDPERRREYQRRRYRALHPDAYSARESQLSNAADGGWATSSNPARDRERATGSHHYLSLRIPQEIWQSLAQVKDYREVMRGSESWNAFLLSILTDYLASNPYRKG